MNQKSQTNRLKQIQKMRTNPLHPWFGGLAIAIALNLGLPAQGDGPKDNLPDSVRPIPPSGISIDASARQALLWRCKAIRTQWQSLLSTKAEEKRSQQRQDEIRSLEPEVLVFPRAVELAIEFNQFYKQKELQAASNLLDEAAQRIKRVAEGSQWAEVVGLNKSDDTRSIIGGFKSNLDDSYQPYGLVVPNGFNTSKRNSHRLDIWFHGRGETLSEVNFLSQQGNGLGQFTPRDTFVLHPYGRYSNAFKFAGEIDVLEALAYVQSKLTIDEHRISVRGFSMGGAGCWQFATHYSDRWFASNPGAGFSETPEFLRFFQDENVKDSAPPYQQTLWNLYDCPPWSRNLLQCPTVAYSGEIDRQKQAADVMAESLKKHGVNLTHIIGPDTAHKIHSDAKIEIERRLRLIERNTTSTTPNHLDLTTFTLRYNRQHWVTILGLEKHWEIANVQATISEAQLIAKTTNISHLKFSFDSGELAEHFSQPITVTIDGQELTGPCQESDRSWTMELIKQEGQWLKKTDQKTAGKKPSLQGPIDDAFMGRFIFVLPSQASKDPLVEQWIQEEVEHAITHWRKHFRGDIRKVLDNDLLESDIASSHLILFGDVDSNSIIKEIANDLPITWNDEDLSLGRRRVPRKGHIPILIYPNPLNPERYIVLNSGFTFREYDYLNNARQTPKLPDWALVDVSKGATSQDPGKIIHAEFFDENWQPISD